MPATSLSSLRFPHNSLSMQTHLLFCQFSILFKKLFSSLDLGHLETAVISLSECIFLVLNKEKKKHLLTLSGRTILYLIGYFPAYMTSLFCTFILRSFFSQRWVTGILHSIKNHISWVPKQRQTVGYKTVWKKKFHKINVVVVTIVHYINSSTEKRHDTKFSQEILSAEDEKNLNHSSTETMQLPR